MRGTVLLLCATASVGLGGCVAAVIPVVAGGVVGRKVLRHPGSGDHARPADPSLDAPPPAAPAIAAAPTDPARMMPGQTYAGGLPAPTGASDEPAAPAPAQRTVPIPPTTWSDVLHYVASRPVTVTQSVLLTRHATGVEPHRLACTGQPRAVIVNTGTNPDGGGDDYIDALRTLGYAIVFTSARPQANDPYFAGKGTASHQLAAGDAFVQLVAGAEGAARARIAARYCVVAIAGRTAADFPDGMTPGAAVAIPGWFAITAR